MTDQDIVLCDENRNALFEFLMFRTFEGRRVPKEHYLPLYNLAAEYFGLKPWKGSLQLS